MGSLLDQPMVARLVALGRGIRGRSALLAAATAAAVLVAGSLAMLWLFRTQLVDNQDQALSQAAASRIELLDSGAAPESLVGGQTMVWIGSSDGTTLARGGSYQPVGNPLPTAHGRAETLELTVEETHSPGEVETERLRVVSMVSTADLVVVVGDETETVDQAVGRMAGLLGAAVPLMVLTVLGTTWLVVGRALNPVERIRSEAAAIGGGDLDRRVPIPSTDDEVRNLAETMNEMLDRLEAHDEGLRRFTADASHELKSPVANLRVLLDTGHLDDPGWTPLQQRLTHELDRLRALIDNLLYLATNNDGGSRTATQSVAIDDLLFAEAETVTATSELKVDVGGVGPAIVTGRRADLQRMMRNLVGNAVRHASTTVSFSCHQDDASGHVVASIADDGAGIELHQRDVIFERFTRLDEARDRDSGGTGLGLAIVKAVAEDHQASIAVSFADEAAKSGTRFTITFPAR